MQVIAPAPAPVSARMRTLLLHRDTRSASAQHRAARALNIELLGLAAATLVIFFGVALVRTAKVARLDEVAPPASVIQLNDLTSAAQLEPVLTMFSSQVE